jgi:hypothetical protein
MFPSLPLLEFSFQANYVYPEISKRAVRHLLPFATTYLYKTTFSHLVHMKNKYRNRLNVELDLRLKLSSFDPDMVLWIVILSSNVINPLGRDEMRSETVSSPIGNSTFQNTSSLRCTPAYGQSWECAKLANGSVSQHWQTMQWIARRIGQLAPCSDFPWVPARQPPHSLPPSLYPPRPTPPRSCWQHYKNSFREVIMWRAVVAKKVTPEALFPELVGLLSVLK